MFTKYAAAALAGSMLLASAAFAAETATTPSTSTTDKAGMQSSASYTGTWRASKVVGLNVYNEQNENVGSINDLLMDKSGNVKAAVLSVGGFLGMGSRYVAIAFDKLKFSDQPVSSASASNAPASGSNNMAKTSTTTTGSAATQPASTSKPNPWYPDHAVINGSKDELKNMPEFKYSE